MSILIIPFQQFFSSVLNIFTSNSVGAPSWVQGFTNSYNTFIVIAPTREFTTFGFTFTNNTLTNSYAVMHAATIIYNPDDWTVAGALKGDRHKEPIPGEPEIIKEVLPEIKEKKSWWKFFKFNKD